MPGLISTVDSSTGDLSLMTFTGELMYRRTILVGERGQVTTFLSGEMFSTLLVAPGVVRWTPSWNKCD